MSCYFFITAGVATAQNKPNFLFILTEDQSSGIIHSLQVNENRENDKYPSDSLMRTAGKLDGNSLELYYVVEGTTETENLAKSLPQFAKQIKQELFDWKEK